MAIVNIYDSTLNQTFIVSFNLVSNILNGDTGDFTGENDIYLSVTSTLNITGLNFGHYIIRNLNDVPEGYATATDFTDLCDKWIDYFLESTIFESSSSSSSSSESSNSSSSSTYNRTTSSTEEKTTSSSSSSYYDDTYTRVVISLAGNASENVNGNYIYDGEMNGGHRYKREDDAYVIFKTVTDEFGFYHYLLTSSYTVTEADYDNNISGGYKTINNEIDDDDNGIMYGNALWTGQINCGFYNLQPPVDVLNIDGTPDASGDYEYLMTLSYSLLPNPVYKRLDGAFYIYNYGGYYIIDSTFSSTPVDPFYSEEGGLIGTYIAFGSCEVKYMNNSSSSSSSSSSSTQARSSSSSSHSSPSSESSYIDQVTVILHPGDEGQPDVSGTYLNDGNMNGYYRYRRSDNLYFLWNSGTSWYIGTDYSTTNPSFKDIFNHHEPYSTLYYGQGIWQGRVNVI